MNCTLWKYLKYSLMMISLVFVSCSSKKTESKIVTGIVFSKEYRDPIECANVVKKGNKKSTQTNQKGEFEIEVEKGDILFISFIGLETKKIIISSKRHYKIVLDYGAGRPLRMPVLISK